MPVDVKLPMNREEVMAYLPHRDPMLFVDRVLSVSETRITIESDIKPDAPFFQGHFPDLPVMPGVLIVETVAQAGALLVALTTGIEDGKFIAFTHVDEARFRKPVYPNETLRVDVEIVKVRGPLYKFSGEAHVENARVASLKFAAAQTDFTQGP